MRKGLTTDQIAAIGARGAPTEELYVPTEVEPHETPEVLALNRHVMHMVEHPPHPHSVAAWLEYRRLLIAALGSTAHGKERGDGK